MAPLMVSRITGAPAARAQSGQRAHSVGLCITIVFSSTWRAAARRGPEPSGLPAAIAVPSAAEEQAGRVHLPYTDAFPRRSAHRAFSQRRNHVEEITSVLDRERSLLLRISRLGPGVIRQGQANGRRPLQ